QPPPTPLPYTTLFRSRGAVSVDIKEQPQAQKQENRQRSHLNHTLGPDRQAPPALPHLRLPVPSGQRSRNLPPDRFMLMDPVMHRSEEHTSELQSRENL